MKFDVDIPVVPIAFVLFRVKCMELDHKLESWIKGGAVGGVQMFGKKEDVGSKCFKKTKRDEANDK